MDQDLALIQQAQLLNETIETQGWLKIVKPLLDKMIVDVIGAQDGNFWDPGSFGDKRLGDVKADRLLWYRQALMEFNNHVYSIILAGEQAQQRLQEFEANQKEPFQNPMVKGDYGPGKKASWSGYDPDGDGGT